MCGYKRRKLSDNEYLRIENGIKSIKIVINKSQMYFSSQCFIQELKDVIYSKQIKKNEEEYFSLWLNNFDKSNYFGTQSFINELKNNIYSRNIKKTRNIYTDKLINNTKKLKDKNQTLINNYKKLKVTNQKLRECIKNMHDERIKMLISFQNVKQRLRLKLENYVEDRHKGYGHHDDVYPIWAVDYCIRELNL